MWPPGGAAPARFQRGQDVVNAARREEEKVATSKEVESGRHEAEIAREFNTSPELHFFNRPIFPTFE